MQHLAAAHQGIFHLYLKKWRQISPSKLDGIRGSVSEAGGSVSAALIAFIFVILSSLSCRSQEVPDLLSLHPGSAYVGKLEDYFEITPSGQVSYEIPIKVPTGTGGMEPKVSISYNGSRRNGLCGVGFDLTGLSVINRAPANLHVDGRAGVVEVNDNDCLMLDGQRLIRVADLGDGRKEWRTEQDSYSRIISQEGDSLGPYSFTVQTKDGLTYSYDATDSPRADRNNPDGTSRIHFLFWLLKRVEDTSGNYLTVTYGTDDTNGEYWPERIDYTGNEAHGLSPYASLRFEYSANPDSTSTYIGGLRLCSSRKLSIVKACYGDSIARRYELSYLSSGSRTLLSQVKEFGTGDSNSRETTIAWNELFSYTHTDSLYQDANVKQEYIIIGDFNGDGISDFCTLPKSSDSPWNGWQLYCGSSSGQVSFESRGSLQVSGEVIYAISGDFNGDGLDDLVFKRKYTSSSVTYYNTDLYLADTVGGQCHLSFHKCVVVSESNSYGIYKVIRNTEDGSDLFVFFTATKNAYFLNAHPTMPLEVKYTPPQSPKNWSLVRVGDFNGDGLTDVMNTNGDTRFLLSDGTGTYAWDSRVLSMACPGNYEDHQVGDLNGDGKSDILVYSREYDYNDNRYYRYFVVYESTGNGFSRHYVGMRKPGDCSLTLADVNGDGRDDMVTFNNTSSESSGGQNAAFHININSGRQFVQYNYGIGSALDKWSFAQGDFNGDGRIDLLCTSNGTGSDWSGYWIYLVPTSPHQLIHSVTDVLGNTTTIEYGYMTDATVHEQGTTVSNYCRSFTAPWPLVSRVTVPDGIGGTRSTTYRYHNALLHKRGRGAMGFERTIVRDEATGTETATHYRVDPEEFVMMPDHRTVTINGHLIEETEMADTLIRTHSHVFSILPKESTTWKYEYNTGELVSQLTTMQEYDSHGNVICLVTETPYKTVVNVNTYADDTTHTGTTSRWLLGRLASATVTKSDGTDTVTLHSAFEYDAVTGLLTAEATEPGDTQLGSRKSYTRDGYGNIVRSVNRTYAANTQQRVTETLYDDKGRFVTAVVNAMGDTTRTVHDPLRCVPLMTVGANNDTIVMTYDGFGNLLTSATAIDTVAVSAMFVGDDGRYAVIRAATGKPTVTLIMDCLGRELSSNTLSMDGRLVCVMTEYDHLGRIARTSEPYFTDLSGSTVYWNENEYDSIGRVIRQTDPAGNCYTMSYTGLVTATTDPLGRVTRKTVDMEGNLVNSEDALGGTVQYAYDLGGHCTQVAGPRTVIITEYDKLGRRTRLVDPDLGEATYCYNGFGELTRQVVGSKVTDYSYDVLGRVTWEMMDDYTIIHTYDSQWRGAPDQVTTFMGGTGRVNYTYDTHGRVISQTELIGNKSFITRFAYDPLNHVSQITYPNGLSVRNVYNGDGYLTEVRNAATDALLWRADSADARGQLSRFTLGNGLSTSVTHDVARGFIERIATAGVQDFSYALNEVGCLTGRTDNLRSLHETFTYDDLDRLVEVSRGGTVTQQMAYDAAGNVTSKTGVGTQIGYQDGTNRVSYIRGGNYTPVQWSELRYSTFNKVTRVSYGSSTLTIAYGWDRQRKLAVSTVDGVATTRYYAGKYYEQEERGDTVRQTCYLYGAEGLFALMVRQDGTDSLRYCHRDHLGSVIGYSDELGRLVQELSYDAWGRRRDPGTWNCLPTLASALALDPHGFTGHEHLDLIELVNMDGRMYDPVLGRFLSPDPLVQAPDFTQSLNRYAYCLNNPLSLTDPTGYSWFSRNWKSLLASVVGIAAAAVTGGLASGFEVAVIAGVAGGIAGAMTGAILNGCNLSRVIQSTFQGAMFGAMSGGLNYGCGEISNILARLAAHSVSDGLMAGVQGGNVLHGAMMGLLSAGSGEGMAAWGGNLKAGAQIAVQAVIGGTISELGGGNFANGAVTAAFAFMFNHLKHNDIDKTVDDELDFEIEVVVPIDAQETTSQLTNVLTAATLLLVVDDGTVIGAIDDPILPFLAAATAISIAYDNYFSPKCIPLTPNPPVIYYGEHTKNARPSTRDKHTFTRSGSSYGENRNNKRGDKNRKYRRKQNPNKKKRK